MLCWDRKVYVTSSLEVVEFWKHANKIIQAGPVGSVLFVSWLKNLVEFTLGYRDRIGLDRYLPVFAASVKTGKCVP